MGLVYRNSRPYLYRSVRRNGRVTSEYLAGGEDAFIIDALERIERGERDSELQQKRSERKQLNDLERALDELAEQARDLAREALSARRDIISTIGANGGGAVSNDVVKMKGTDRAMDHWAIEKLIDWAAGKKR